MPSDNSWRILYVDDEEDILANIKEILEDEPLTAAQDAATVDMFQNFTTALDRIEATRYDLLILDVREGSYDIDRDPEAGAQLLKEIQQRQFLPIIFYTGLPDRVRELETPPFIQVVEKSDSPQPLLDAVVNVIESRLPSVNRALVRHLETVQRDYMWEFVAENWDDIISQSDHTTISYLLSRRLASTLTGPGISRLTENLGGQSSGLTTLDQVHPMQYYIVPPIANQPMVAGDIYNGTIESEQGYWVIITPSCDLFQKKAEWVLLAACMRLVDQPEFEEWSASQSRRKEAKLAKLLKNNRENVQQDRHYYLPGTLGIPDLVVDLQRIRALERNSFESLDLERVATLDSPFAEALTSRFSRYFGRIGTPDLDSALVIANLKANHLDNRTS